MSGFELNEFLASKREESDDDPNRLIDSSEVGKPSLALQEGSEGWIGLRDVLKLEEVGSKVNLGAVAGESHSAGLAGGTNPSLKLRYIGNDLQQGRSADATRTIEGNRVEHRLERSIRLGFDDGRQEGEGFERLEYCVGRAAALLLEAQRVLPPPRHPLYQQRCRRLQTRTQSLSFEAPDLNPMSLTDPAVPPLAGLQYPGVLKPRIPRLRRRQNMRLPFPGDTSTTNSYPDPRTSPPTDPAAPAPLAGIRCVARVEILTTDDPPLPRHQQTPPLPLLLLHQVYPHPPPSRPLRRRRRGTAQSPPGRARGCPSPWRSKALKNYNRALGYGSAVPFEPVPFPDGSLADANPSVSPHLLLIQSPPPIFSSPSSSYLPSFLFFLSPYAILDTQ
ncbi:hypothetical protein B0H14DRAFT_3152480, partial [Mycena olivaceomarginata]